MSYCINPFCSKRHNPDNAEFCLACGNSLLINGRIRLLRPLTRLGDEISYTDVFEVEDAGIESHPEAQRRILKVLYWNDDSKYAELFQREALVLQVLNHPGIPKSTREDYFIFRLNDNLLKMPCIVMQKFEGENLREWLKFNGQVSEPVAYDCLFQLVSILDTVHRSGFFHRDIKPENIIYQPDGQIALVDFGAAREITKTYLAKVSTSGGSSTGLGSGHEVTAVRTACYSPLEQINGQAVPQSDFYALGRTMVDLVTGISLFEIKSDEKTGRLLWRDKAPHIDKNIADLIDDLMAPFPGQRPQSTQLIIQRLERLPFQSKLNRVIKSNLFKVAVGILGFLSIAGLIYVSLPLIANYYLNEGKKAQKENRFELAKNDFNKAVKLNYKLNPVVANYLMEQGEKSHKENRITEAEKDFEAAVKYHYSLTYSISKFYFEQAERRGIAPNVAKKYYELAIKFNPKDIVIYNNLALICQDLADEKCVNDSYGKLFKLKPNAWEGHYGLGSFYDDRTEYELAEIQYKLAIQNSNGDPQPINNLARLKNITGDYNTAVSLALEGLQKTKDPEIQATLYKNLGWGKLGLKLYSEAKEYLEKAKDLDSKRTDAYCLLAQVNEALGEINHARINWEVCLIAESNQLEVQEWRKQVLKRLLGDIVPGSSP